MTGAESIDTAPCWVLTPGHAGMRNQAVALAEAVGLPYACKDVRPRAPWVWLPPACWPQPLRSLHPDSDPVAPPWPRLLITCGRRSVPFALLIRRLSGGRTRTVHIQNPQTRLNRFDLVAAPRHDRLSGANLIETAGSLHNITEASLAAAAAKFADRLHDLPRPLVAVLIGGANRCYRFPAGDALRIGRSLAALSDRTGCGLAVTASRRTGDDNRRLIEQELRGRPVYFWDMAGENPYFGFLGLADAILVTCDSVNMVSEACGTGKPVQVIELEGGNRKFRRFHDDMRAAGFTRRFDGSLQNWTYPPLREVSAVAERVRRELLAPAT